MTEHQQNNPSTTGYNHLEVEPFWQKQWEENNVFEVSANQAGSKPKSYILEMFPYPSGTIHMGHVRNYSMGDVIARFKALRGYQVLHPMGWDAFGLPAENAAIKNKTHPAKWTYSNIEYTRGQFKKIGCLYDWRREVTTCSPDYYKWEQLFFIKMLEKGLAYRKLSSVNWCSSCNTVLANEQVEAGLCWRCENEVTTKELTQWFLKITDYAEELLSGLDDLEGWPERVRTMQKNWIGKSLGAEVEFEVAEGKLKGTKISIFTTRVDTICGVSFLSLAPEHPLTLELAKGLATEKAVVAFVEKVRKVDKIKRTAENYEKEGVPIGVNVINPVNGQKIPLYAANFVLMEYGTGAVMAVPAHDERDHAFAVKYKLPIKQVIEPVSDAVVNISEQAFTEQGRLVESGPFSGLTSEQALMQIPTWLESKKLGRKTINYKLRDWGISRQRYWGAPIPVIHCEKCGTVPVPADQLPVVLPEDVTFTGTGESPLAKNNAFLNTPCPQCKGSGKRETDTMDTFMESSWYHLRYCSLKNQTDAPFNLDEIKYWLPIDQYIGGIEHATMHLLYFRFLHRVLQDLEFIPKDVAQVIGREPAKRLLNQGIVYKDGAKMSKSKGNIVDPNAMIAKFGADTTRVFSLFAAPAEKVLEWSDQGVEGAYRFLGRVWRMVQNNLTHIKDCGPYSGKHNELDAVDVKLKALRMKTHQTISKVTNDLEQFHFNTAIAAIMELVNEIYLFTGATIANESAVISNTSSSVLRESIEAVVRLLNPYAPHLTEELWRVLGHQNDMLVTSSWPSFDPEAIVQNEIKIVIQVNGKLRGELMVEKGTDAAEIEKLAKADTKVMAHLQGKNIKKVIQVPGKLINFVAV